MKNIFTVLSTSIVVLFAIHSCTNKASIEDLKEKITTLEASIHETSKQGLDTAKGNELLNTYLEFSNNYPNEPESPDYLYKAAAVASGLQKNVDAIKYYEKINSKYPKYSRTPESIMIQAFLYETQLNDIKKAKLKYTEFITKYPEHHLIEDAKLSLKNLGKSLDQIINESEQAVVNK